MGRHPLKRRSQAGIGALALFLAAGALGEEAVRPPRERALEEIVVTAQKREELLKDVPVSVAAISGIDMEERNLVTLEEITRSVPNVVAHTENSVQQYFVRGIGTSTESDGAQPSVTVIIDDIPYPETSFIRGMLVDMERIELLRGPQGTLFGKDTVAGVFNVVTAAPSYEWEGKVNAQIGDLESRRIEGVLNVPVIQDRLATRVLGGIGQRDGYMFNTTRREDDGAKKEHSLATKIGWEIAEDLSLRVSARRSETRLPKGFGYQSVAFPDDLRPAAEEADPEFETDADLRSSKDRDEFTTFRTWATDGRLKWTLGGYDLALIAGYSEMKVDFELDADYSPLHLVDFGIDADSSAAVSELKLTSPIGLMNGRLEFVTGLFGSYERRKLFVPVNVVPTVPFVLETLGLPADTPVDDDGAIDLDIWQDVAITTLAAYGQGTWAFTDTIDAIGGLRYSWVRNEAIDIRNATDVQGVPGTGAVTGPTADLGDRENRGNEMVDQAVSGKIAGRWRPDDDTTVFATIGTGFKAGGWTLTLREDPEKNRYEPEHSISYEIGAKRSWLDGLLRTNLTAFWMDFRDQQVRIFDGLNSQLSNSAKARSRGLELETQSLLPYGLFLGVSGAWLDAFNVKYDDAPCAVGADDPDGDGICDLSGKRTAYAPELAAAGSLAGEWPLADWLPMLTAGLEASYQDFVYFQSDVDPVDSQDAYWLLNARVGFASESGRWRLTAFVDNVTDEIFKVYGNDMPIFEGGHWASVASPRTVSVAATVNF